MPVNGRTSVLVLSSPKTMLLVLTPRIPMLSPPPKTPLPLRVKPPRRFPNLNPKRLSRHMMNTSLSLPSAKLTLAPLLKSAARTRVVATKSGPLPKNCPARRRRRATTSLVNPRTRQGTGNAKPSKYLTSSHGLSNLGKPAVAAHVEDVDVAPIEEDVGAATEVPVVVIVAIAVVVTTMGTGVPGPLSTSRTPVLSRAWGHKS